MKRIIRASALLVGGMMAVGLTSCGAGKKTLLKEPAEAESLWYEERQEEGVVSVKNSAEAFAAKFTPSLYKKENPSKNFAVSPVSVYMALALTTACAKGETKEEILSALNISDTALSENFSDYYRSVMAEFEADGKEIGCIRLSNSVWLDQSAQPKEACLSDLANNYLCYSYWADFAHDNRSANAAVRNFVKEKTKGIIDQDFKLPVETVFALINTLYLKDVWNTYGQDLPFTDHEISFKQADGSTKTQKMLQGYYNVGRTYVTESYRTFFTETEHGCRVKFILPNDGYTLDEVFTQQTLNELSARKYYNAIDEEQKICYNTRCIFPEFHAEYNGNVDGLLKEIFGIKKLFDPVSCDLTGLVEPTTENVYCERVTHVADLKVNEKGIEGAAVTIMAADGAAAPEYEDRYEEFIVNEAFGYVVTDYYGNTLFSGVVKNV